MDYSIGNVHKCHSVMWLSAIITCI